MNTVNPFYEIRSKTQTSSSLASEQIALWSLDAPSADRCPCECCACSSQGYSNQLQSIRFYLVSPVLWTRYGLGSERWHCLSYDRDNPTESQPQRDPGLGRY